MSLPIYVTREKLIDLLTLAQQKRLVDDDLTSDEPVLDDAMIDTYLRHAESSAESYVGGRYTVPLVDWPESIEYAILVIARHRLFQRRSLVIEDEMQAEYDHQIRWLKDIQAHRADLYFGDAVEGNEGVSSGYGDLTNIETGTNLFLT